jgi:hypothetical protein
MREANVSVAEMNAPINKLTCAALIGLSAYLNAIGGARAQPGANVKLNEKAVALASQLIREGQLIDDGKGAWRGHRPSPAMENEFIRRHGFAEYARWHLGVDERYAVDTKRRYKFPYGDFTKVHRCGLLAVKARAQQYGYAEIQNAAAELERTLESQLNTLHPSANGELNNSKRNSTAAVKIKQIAP